MISTGHARTLLAIEDHEEQYNLANKIFDEKLSVRETEKLIIIRPVSGRRMPDDRLHRKGHYRLCYRC